MRNVLFEIVTTTRQIGAGVMGVSLPVFFVNGNAARMILLAGFFTYVVSILGQVLTMREES